MKAIPLLLAAFGGALMAASVSLVAAEEKPASVESGPVESSKDMNTVLQRIPSRIDQLALARVSQASNDWTAYYRWSRGAISVVPYAISVRVQSHDSAEAAEQGVKTNVKMTSVGWTRLEDFRGIRLYVWDTTMGSGEQQLRVGPRLLFRVGNDVVNLSTGDKTVGMDFLMKVLEVVADELKTAGK